MAPALELLTLAAWVALVLLALSRRSASAVELYRLAAIAATAAAVVAGRAQPAWLLIAAVWVVVKVLWLPAYLRRRLAAAQYGVASFGTPRLVIGCALILGLLWWSLGPLGLPLGVVVSMLWLALMRHELWQQALLLLAAELGVGLLAILATASAGWADALMAVELGLLGMLVAWLDRRMRQDFLQAPTSRQLTNLKG